MPKLAIQEKKLIKALAEGKTKAEAGRIAGSTAINPTSTVNAYLKKNPEVLTKIGSIIDRAIDSIGKHLTDDKIAKEDAASQIKMLETAQKIKNIEEGNPTEITEIREMTTEELMEKIEGVVYENDIQIDSLAIEKQQDKERPRIEVKII